MRRIEIRKNPHEIHNRKKPCPVFVTCFEYLHILEEDY